MKPSNRFTVALMAAAVFVLCFGNNVNGGVIEVAPPANVVPAVVKAQPVSFQNVAPIPVRILNATGTLAAEIPACVFDSEQSVNVDNCPKKTIDPGTYRTEYEIRDAKGQLIWTLRGNVSVPEIGRNVVAWTNVRVQAGATKSARR